MALPLWAIQTALILGLTGLGSLVWGYDRGNTVAIRIGHCVVGAHMFMYFLGSGGYWIVVGVSALSFVVSGFLFSLSPGKYRGVFWAVLGLPPGLAYVVSMGTFLAILNSDM